MSLALHGLLFAGILYYGLPDFGLPVGSPTGSAAGGRDKAEMTGPWGQDAAAIISEVRRVQFLVPNNRAPELLPPPMQPIQPRFDSQVRPASASLPLQAAPQVPPEISPPATSVAPSSDGALNGDPGSSAAEAELFGVRSRGAKFVYVFDRSASMEGRALSMAKRELIASLNQLDRIHQFQIIFYNQQPQLMPAFRGQEPRMVFADEQGKRLAASFVGGIFADGGTDNLAALNMALALRPDVIFFLTDSNDPQMQPQELVRVRQFNRGTRINTIEFGAGEPKAAINFLQRLASENGGQHTYVDVQRTWR